MQDFLVVVAFLTSPFWLLMLFSAGKDRSRVQVRTQTVLDIAQRLNMKVSREGGEIRLSGEVDGVPMELVASGFETSPRLKIRVPLPTSLKVLSFRPKDGTKGIGKFETGDKNFDSVVAADGDGMWLAAILDPTVRLNVVSFVLSISGRVHDGSLTAEVPIMLPEDQEEQDGAGNPAKPPEDGSVKVTLSTQTEPTGTVGYLVSCVEKSASIAKALLAHVMVKVDRLANQAKDDPAVGIRLAAIRGLMVMQRTERILSFLNDPDLTVRFYTACQLGDQGVPVLEALLAEIPGPGLPSDHRLPPDRIAEALKSLKIGKEPEKLLPVLALLARSVDVPIRHAAISAMVRFQIPGALDVLLSLPDAAEDRLMMIQSLLTLAEPKGEEILWRMLSVPDDSLRSKVLDALLQLGSMRSVPILLSYASGKLPDFSVPAGKGEARPRLERAVMVSQALCKQAREVAMEIQRRFEGKGVAPPLDDVLAGSVAPPPEKPSPEKAAPEKPAAEKPAAEKPAADKLADKPASEQPSPEKGPKSAEAQGASAPEKPAPKEAPAPRSETSRPAAESRSGSPKSEVMARMEAARAAALQQAAQMPKRQLGLEAGSKKKPPQ